jgi:hypothetical protein
MLQLVSKHQQQNACSRPLLSNDGGTKELYECIRGRILMLAFSFFERRDVQRHFEAERHQHSTLAWDQKKDHLLLTITIQRNKHGPLDTSSHAHCAQVRWKQTTTLHTEADTAALHIQWAKTGLL